MSKQKDDQNEALLESRRHPLFGWMKDTVTIAPGTDLTAPACPELADLMDAKCDRIARAMLESRKKRP